MGWLENRTVRLVGTSPAIATALEAQGARLVDAGDCDILVHVIAPPVDRAAHEMRYEEWRATLDAGLDRRFALARDFAIERRTAGMGGAVIFIGAPEQALGSDHAAAAGALGNLTKTLGVEWARDGIRVNAVLTFAQTPTLGNVVAYLASDYAAYVTGAVIGIGLDD
ncbi:SDR family oxidoreductase [Novosphingobium sp. KCTC 2891]|uniref:SDR family oxidoreductase n=1 Tax=unclassified Novosphingobium TaxID=2644732 RepID=UPI0022218683|nr:SDR family oxidoreductase [Novosphingobium sp. KCTC 2891]MCW1384789.1 SDR family oxidoreductase [Novosphingobium sp. KCTC 2891]